MMGWTPAPPEPPFARSQAKQRDQEDAEEKYAMSHGEWDGHGIWVKLGGGACRQKSRSDAVAECWVL
jgi:hypothetical protein